MGLILLGVFTISVFKAASEFENAVSQAPNTMAKAVSIIAGLVAASAYGGEVILIKELSKLNVHGSDSGYFYTLFVGIEGLIGLSLYSIAGQMATAPFTLKDYLLILLGGVSESVGVVLQTYAASIGIGGIAFGISNACCVYVLIFNYFVMGQDITMA